MLALFLALQIQPGEVPNRRSSDCVVGHTPFESSRKPVQCTRHGPAFDMKGVQVARLRPERGSFARRMVVADARMSLDPLPPQKSRRRIHWHFLKHLELFLLDCPRFPRLVELCEMPVDLQAAQNLLWPRCRRSLRNAFRVPVTNATPDGLKKFPWRWTLDPVPGCIRPASSNRSPRRRGCRSRQDHNLGNCPCRNRGSAPDTRSAPASELPHRRGAGSTIRGGSSCARRS